MGLLIVYNRAGVQSAIVFDDYFEATREAARILAAAGDTLRLRVIDIDKEP